MKNFKIILIFYLFKTSLAQEIVGRIYFLKNTSDLTPEAKEIIKKIAQELKERTNIIIDIVGYTDSLGSLKKNLELSKGRAEVVKRHLINDYGIEKERINTFGFGPRNPIASNKDEEGRKLNRRVEIYIRPPDAILSWYRNNVFIQPSYLHYWMDAFSDAYLYKLYKVNTKNKSSAEIFFPGKGELLVDEEALIIIYGFTEKIKKTDFKNVEISKGAIRSLLRGLSKEENFVVNTPAAFVELYSKNSKIHVNKKLATLLSIYEGKALVSASGIEVTVNEGEGTKVEMGKPPEPPRPLPDVPKVVLPLKDTTLSGEKILFKWIKNSFLTHIQCAQDSIFREIIEDTVLIEDSLILKLPSGVYFWRISGIDKDSLEGKFSDIFKFEIIEEIKFNFSIDRIVKDEAGNFIIKGKVDPYIEVLIDNEKVKVNEDGSFYHILKTKKNKVIVDLIDREGNTISTELNLDE
ncbi:MAG: OmpA family protein [Candidatus Hydrothermales bacterium]